MPVLGSLPLTVKQFILAIIDWKLTPKNFSKIILETHASANAFKIMDYVFALSMVAFRTKGLV